MNLYDLNILRTEESSGKPPEGYRKQLEFGLTSVEKTVGVGVVAVFGYSHDCCCNFVGRMAWVAVVPNEVHKFEEMDLGYVDTAAAAAAGDDDDADTDAGVDDAAVVVA